jgi:DNA-directed RNA polymerase specialized sigma24 family protein
MAESLVTHYAHRSPRFEYHVPAGADADVVDVLALDAALQKLAALDERRVRVVELRYFGGLTVEETADVLQVSADTVARDWRLARAWLRRELRASSAE